MNAKFIKLGLITTLVASLSQAEELKIDPFVGVEYSLTKATTEYDYKDNTFIQDFDSSYTSTSTSIKFGAVIEDVHRVYFLGNNNASIHFTYNYLFNIQSGFDVYAGLGAGYQSYESDRDVSIKGFTMKIEAGVLYRIHPQLQIDAGYRRMETSSSQETRYYETKVTGGNVFFAGILYNF